MNQKRKKNESQKETKNTGGLKPRAMENHSQAGEGIYLNQETK